MKTVRIGRGQYVIWDDWKRIEKLDPIKKFHSDKKIVLMSKLREEIKKQCTVHQKQK